MAKLQVEYVHDDDFLKEEGGDGACVVVDVFRGEAFGNAEMAEVNSDIHKEFRFTVSGHIEDSVPLIVLVEQRYGTRWRQIFRREYGERD